MVDVFGKHGGPVIAVQQVPKSEISAYGVIDGIPRGGRGPGLPPARPRGEAAGRKGAVRPRLIGRYIRTPDIFEELEKTPRDQSGEIQLTNGMRQLSRNRSLFGYRFGGRRHDAGNKLGFLKATVEFALKRPDLGGPSAST